MNSAPKYSKKHKMCRHYVGIGPKSSGSPCLLGIDPSKLEGIKQPWIFNAPCSRSNDCATPCAKFEPHTAEEVEADEKEWQELIGRSDILLPFIQKIKKEHKKGERGETICPLCANTLKWSLSSYNSHFHGRCETEGCVQVME